MNNCDDGEDLLEKKFQRRYWSGFSIILLIQIAIFYVLYRLFVSH